MISREVTCNTHSPGNAKSRYLLIEAAMIAWDIWILFFGYTVPMVVSPGPGNTLLATAGGRFGIAGSLPFWIGFEVGNLVLCVAYGLGLGRLLHGYPNIETIIKWAGIAYTLYLAWGFFRSSAGATDNGARRLQHLGIRDGFLSVVLNPKIHSMILVMFSQFLNPVKPLGMQVALFTIAFLVVCVVCHFPWIYGGQLVMRRFQSTRAVKIQGQVFGICMLLVAAYMAFS
ncbi:Lysine transporter LysE [Bordetella tumulicola]